MSNACPPKCSDADCSAALVPPPPRARRAMAIQHGRDGFVGIHQIMRVGHFYCQLRTYIVLIQLREIVADSLHLQMRSSIMQHRGETGVPSDQESINDRP